MLYDDYPRLERGTELYEAFYRFPHRFCAARSDEAAWLPSFTHLSTSFSLNFYRRPTLWAGMFLRSIHL